MHNMPGIGIDYGRALNLVHPETNNKKKHEFEGRMCYIGLYLGLSIALVSGRSMRQ
jgi:hypothetical protein